MATLTEITAGFLPLTDSAILVAARECGFAEQEDIALTLMRETSWANIRDRIAIGHFQAAHMLAPMPIAAAVGLTPFPLDIIVPMALGLGGNAVTASSDLAQQLADAGAGGIMDPATTGAALKRIVEARAGSGAPKLRFGVVHAHSGHNFELRYWLAASGIAPDRDVDIVILPPPFMPDALAAGRIDAFCVGEPWNSVAVSASAGRIVTTKSAIWKSSPEKVFAVRSDWARQHPQLLSRLLRALYRAAEWCGQPQNHDALSHILARPDYLAQPAALVVKALDNSIVGGQKGADDTRFFEPFGRAATFPWQSHALWFYSQMVRWGQVEHTPAHADAARRCYRPDLYRDALRPLAVSVPAANAKAEGALVRTTPVGAGVGSLSLGPDGFFDGRIFDPDQLDAYLAAQK